MSTLYLVSFQVVDNKIISQTVPVSVNPYSLKCYKMKRKINLPFIDKSACHSRCLDYGKVLSID